MKAATPDWIPATVLLREIKTFGDRGGYSILKDYLATLRPLAKPEPVIRFETDLGARCRPTLRLSGAGAIGWLVHRHAGLEPGSVRRVRD